MKKTILITWWTGYIGSHWVVAFEQAWYKTVIVDNLVNSNLEALDWIEKIIWYKPDFYNLDLRNTSHLAPFLWEERGINYVNNKKIEWNFSLEEVFKKYNFDGVIHFAGLKAVWESCEKPLEYFDNNIVWSIRLLEMMEKYGVKNIVFSSSATVYTSPQPYPLKEREQEQKWISEDFVTWNTTNPYWTTKFIIEQILKDLANFSGFKVMNLRYFNPIWAHSSWEIWENPAWIPNNLLPFIMKVATGELEELKVFWDNYPTIDWTWVRDYIDVVDLIEGHLKAYEKIELLSLPSLPLNKKSPPSPPLEGETSSTRLEWIFETYNLWVGRGVSVLEMVKVVEKIIWKKIPYKIVERRSWDLAEVYCNPMKAKKELNWETKISLEDSIKNSWKFCNKN